jgi:hypothetical protein
MRASKDPLERWGCLLPFWYLTPRQISDKTVPDFNLLTAARSQVQIDVIIWSSLLEGDVAGLSIAIHYRASKSDAPTRNLVTIIESSCDGSLSRLRFWARILNQIAILTVFSTFWILYESRQLCLKQSHHWGRLLFHCPETYQVVLSFETLPTGHFAWVFSRLAASSPFRRAWAKVKVPW